VKARQNSQYESRRGESIQEINGDAYPGQR
jgi:hypothetical protein